MIWKMSHRADKRALPIADRHYNRQKPGTPQFVPPGRCLVLLAKDEQALWVTAYPFAQYVKHQWAGAWVNSMFRREGGCYQASEMIREAVAISRSVWEPPELGIVTFVDPRHVKPTQVHGETVYGFSYLRAGFKHVGFTRKDNLWAWQLLPEDMPPALHIDAEGNEVMVL